MPIAVKGDLRGGFSPIVSSPGGREKSSFRRPYPGRLTIPSPATRASERSWTGCSYRGIERNLNHLCLEFIKLAKIFQFPFIIPIEEELMKSGIGEDLLIPIHLVFNRNHTAA